MITDGFAGPGGWSEGLRLLGLRDIGLELDTAACKTRTAAGHLTIQCDVAQYPTEPFKGRATGQIWSPPCQAWTRTGDRHGIADQPLVHQAVNDLANGRDTRAELLAGCQDKRSLLAAEPMRWLYDLRPEWVAMEEVPDVLPLWRQFAQHLQPWGYSTWTGVLDAADYGVPQNRQRAILIASRTRKVTGPSATHAKAPEWDLFGECQQQWISVGQTLGWSGPRVVISNYGDPTTATGRGERTGDAPSWTITSKLSRIKILDPRDGSIGRLSTQQAGVIQTFPADYPWRGTKTEQDQQVGNAVPPLLAAHIVSAATGIPMPAAVDGEVAA
ncbi:DNA cytosine methyltransferase [Streptomyces mirabilis]|uniref:DNA cytosine methyltransferase n=1 Tax=Streptomyces mirabilis TaxID=68239 RepID=UPI00368E6E31